jgi:hypothetical protein
MADHRYKAFISYSHADEKWARWLHQALERYRVPRHLHASGAPRLGAVFRDRDELPSAASLTGQIEQALRDAEFLIVICSNAAAASTWVDAEVEYFRGLGRADKILCLIVDDGPPACFPPALLADADHHPLAADVRDSGDGRRDGLLKIVAGLLGVGFDDLRRRDAQRRRRRLTLTALASTTGLLAATALTIMLVLAQRDAAEQRQRAELAQRFGQDVGRLESQLRVAQMRPVHDLTLEYRAFEARLAEIAEQMKDLGSTAQGAGEYAIGHGLLALGRYQEALPHLNNAWNGGLRSPEIAFDRGVALGQLYKDAFNQARAVRNAHQREQQIEAAREQYRLPALMALSESRSAPSAPLPYVDALIAFHDRRYAEALAHLETALSDDPWLWEAYNLRGDVLFTQGSETFQDDLAAGNRYFDRARDAYQQALEIAPSAVSTARRICDNSVFELFTQLQLRDSEQLFEERRADAAAACDRLEAVLPESESLLANRANIELMTVRYLVANGEDTAEVLARATGYAKQAVAQAPDSAYALRALGDAVYLDGRRKWENGADARALLAEAAGLYEQAAAIEASVAANNNAANAYYLIADTAADLDEDPTPSLNKAVAAYRRALLLDPDALLTHANIALAMNRRAGWEMEHGVDTHALLAEAAALIQEQIDKNAEIAFLFSLLAAVNRDQVQLSLMTGRDPRQFVEQARTAAARAVELDARNFAVLDTLARVEIMEAGRRQAAGLDPAVELEAAFAAIQAYDAIFPNQARAEIRRAQAYVVHAQAADDASAVSEYLELGTTAVNRALALQPDQRGEILLEEVRLQRLRVEQAPADAEVLAAADAAVAQLLAARPRHADSLLAAAHLLLALRQARGDTTTPDPELDAAVLLQRATDINPLQRQVADQIVERYVLAGNGDPA